MLILCVTEGEFARKLADPGGNVAFVTAHSGMSLPMPGFVGFLSICSHVEN